MPFKSLKDNELLVKQTATGYEAMSGKNKNIVFTVEKKVATTKGEFRFRSNKIYFGKLLKDYPILRTYTFVDKDENKATSISFSKSDKLGMTCEVEDLKNGQFYRSNTIDAGKSFTFRNKKKIIVFTIDKNVIDFTDSFKVSIVEPMEKWLVTAVTIAIDDFFHP